MDILKEDIKRQKELMNLQKEKTNTTKSGVMEQISGGSGFEQNQGGSDTLTKFKKRQEVGEDAGMDTPGGNPDYFYDEDSLFAKEKGFPDNLENMLNKLSPQDGMVMSKEDIVSELLAIYSYSQDGATDLVNTSLETLITNLGGFKDNINEQEDEGDLETEEENVKLGRIIKDIINSYKREGVITDMDTEKEFYYMLKNMKAYGQTSDFFNMKRWDVRNNKRKFPKAYNLLPPLEAFKLLCKHTK